MPLDVLITTNRIDNDPIARTFIEHIRKNQQSLQLSEAAIYYDFPTYADYETVAHKPDALLLSPIHGVLAIRFVDKLAASGFADSIDEYDESLVQFSSILIGRFLKSKHLRKSLSQVVFDVVPVIYIRDTEIDQDELLQSKQIRSLEGFEHLLKECAQPKVSQAAVAEARSVIEGAKALSRPKARQIVNPEVPKPVTALAKLESDIANFDEKQRRAALINFTGPQRIRGLAGSGKTVILAMKAAHLHLTSPEANILVTFYTKSLRASLKNLITRFFRNFKDEDPNWDRIHIRHGWGGASVNGVYVDTCRRHEAAPMTFGVAQQAAIAAARNSAVRERIDPFNYACRELIRKVNISPFYDHILIDEGQDFPIGFYQICFLLSKGDRDAKNIVWAYDELQNILDVKIRTPEELFGVDIDGTPKVSLERAARALPQGTDNDTVLSKCYRNQREILLTAHALGFGIYGNIVQLLESRDHWEDVGYRVLSNGAFKVNDEVKIERPIENSPISIDNADKTKLIDVFSATNVDSETDWVASQVKFFLDGGLQPEDIIVIVLDDRSSKTYLRFISTKLSLIGVSSNNITADPYNEPPFSLAGRVTLSTVYRAKGNEASVVIAVGVDAVPLQSRLGRNKLFTAFTRTKAWLRVSGVHPNANFVFKEIEEAINHFPYLDFKMPDLKKIETIQRDLNKRTIKVKKLHAEYVRKLRDEGLNEEEADELLSLLGNETPQRLGGQK